VTSAVSLSLICLIINNAHAAIIATATMLSEMANRFMEFSFIVKRMGSHLNKGKIGKIGIRLEWR
jgi:hypothetical protein